MIMHNNAILIWKTLACREWNGSDCYKYNVEKNHLNASWSNIT